MKKYNWVLTDDDCSQYVRQAFEEGRRCYECIQIVELTEDKYGIAHDIINLSEYSAEERRQILDAYYDNHERTGLSDQVMAECAFETFALNNIEKTFSNREDAESYIQDKLWENILIKAGDSTGYIYLKILSSCYEPMNIIELFKFFDEAYQEQNNDVSMWAVEFEELSSSLIYSSEFLLNPKNLSLDDESVHYLIKLMDTEDRYAYLQARKYLKGKGLI